MAIVSDLAVETIDVGERVHWLPVHGQNHVTHLETRAIVGYRERRKFLHFAIRLPVETKRAD